MVEVYPYRHNENSLGSDVLSKILFDIRATSLPLSCSYGWQVRIYLNIIYVKASSLSIHSNRIASHISLMFVAIAWYQRPLKAWIIIESPVHYTHTTWSFNRLLENHAELLSSHTFTCHLICLCYGAMRSFFETVKQCGLSRRIYCDTGDKQVTKGIWIYKDARKHRKTTHKTVTVPITINVPENEPSVKTALVYWRRFDRRIWWS